MNRHVFMMLAGLLLTPVAQAGVYDDILFFANQNETDKVVDLLRRGMDVNTTDPQGNSLLTIAVRGNNLELVRFLLDNRANPQRKNRYGDTALMIAALQGRTEIVRLMVERKIDLNHDGWNPLHYAAFEGHADIISILLASGADINLKAPNAYTALMLAAKRGHLEAVRTLVGANADLSVADPEEGTALDMAQKANHTEVAAFLNRAAASR
ncbi:ankyrin repeat domain-containing protein [Rhodocyclaceae bacterium]